MGVSERKAVLVSRNNNAFISIRILFISEGQEENLPRQSPFLPSALYGFLSGRDLFYHTTMVGDRKNNKLLLSRGDGVHDKKWVNDIVLINSQRLFFRSISSSVALAAGGCGILWALARFE